MSDFNPPDYYAVLGLRQTATPLQIKMKYRQLALLKHPDKQDPDNRNSSATAEFQLLVAAYSTLSDPDRRRDYDEHDYPAARGADGEESFSGWNASSWAMDSSVNREPRPYSGPAGCDPVYDAAADYLRPSAPDVPPHTPTTKIPEKPSTSPRPDIPTTATYQAHRIALGRQLSDLQNKQVRLKREAQRARADLADVDRSLEQLVAKANMEDAASRRPTIGSVFSSRKKAEEEARLQERVIKRNLERRAKECERDRIFGSLGELNMRLRAVEEGMVQLRKDWDATWAKEKAEMDAVKAWELREAEREKARAEERERQREMANVEAAKRKKAMMEARLRELERAAEEADKADKARAEKLKADFARKVAEAHDRDGNQKATDSSTNNSTSTSTDNKTWGPYTTKPPSRPLPLTPDEMKARFTRRERMVNEEIAEMDRCYNMMQQQEEERASTRAAQEAAAIYTEESLRPPPPPHGPPPAYRAPSPPIKHVSVPPLTRYDGTICYHKGVWASRKGNYTCARCRTPKDAIIRIFRCKACVREVCATCWGDVS
ncbi:hypothetical protein QBC39DRAFT_329038 [Podospora conica]|nr:hypothetical protein QBC39DRAFT_329038 [Schizothecium conicum]